MSEFRENSDELRSRRETQRLLMVSEVCFQVISFTLEDKHAAGLESKDQIRFIVKQDFTYKEYAMVSGA